MRRLKKKKKQTVEEGSSGEESKNRRKEKKRRRGKKKIPGLSKKGADPSNSGKKRRTIAKKRRGGSWTKRGRSKRGHVERVRSLVDGQSLLPEDSKKERGGRRTRKTNQVEPNRYRGAPTKIYDGLGRGLWRGGGKHNTAGKERVLWREGGNIGLLWTQHLRGQKGYQKRTPNHLLSEKMKKRKNG